MNIVKLKKGRYLIGDPCYQFTGRPHAEWHKFLSVNNLFEDTQGTGYEQELAVFGTAWGDGAYFDNEGIEYPVDAGLIGAVHYVEGTEVPDGNHVYSFDTPFECFNDNGILHFGNVVIDTAGDMSEIVDGEDEEDEGILIDEF